MGLVSYIYDEVKKQGIAGAQRLLKQLSAGAQDLGRNAENVIMGGPLPLATPTPNPRRLLPDVPRRSLTVTPADIQRADQLRQIVPTVRARAALPNISGPRQGVTTADRELADRLVRREVSVPPDDATALFERLSGRDPSIFIPQSPNSAVRSLVNKQKAEALYEHLRGQAPSPRDIPTSVPEYLQGTFLKPGPGEVKGPGMPLRYPAGTQAVGGGKLGNTTYGEGVEANIGAFLGPVPPPNRLNVMEAIEQNIRLTPRAPGGEVRGRSLFTEPDPFTGRIEISPRINLPPEPFEFLAKPKFGPVNRGADTVAAPVTKLLSPGADVVVDPVAANVVVDPVAKAIRNAAGGIQMGDLNTLIDVVRNNPIRSISALGGAGLAGFGLTTGIGNMMRGDEGSAPLDLKEETRTPPGEPVVTPTGINQPEQLPVLFADNDGTPLGSVGSPEQNQPMPRRSDPTAPAPVITRGGDRISDMREQLAQYSPRAAAIARAMEPRSPERYKSAEDYYAARAAYANQAPVKQALMRYVEETGSSPAESTALRTWAQSYPALAYEMQRRSMVNPEANQQTQQSVTTTTITTPMGSNNQANAIGNAEATAQSAVAPTQGSFELRSATTPMEQPVLTPAEEFLQRLSVPQRDQMMYY